MAKILIVNDYLDMRESIKIELVGYEFGEAESVEKALHEARTNGYDAMILDDDLTRSDRDDGIDIATTLRKEGYTKPIIMVSEKDLLSMQKQKLKDLGVILYDKKYDLSKLQKVLEEAGIPASKSIH